MILVLYLEVLFEYFFPPIINFGSQDTSFHLISFESAADSSLEEFNGDIYTVVPSWYVQSYSKIFRVTLLQ